MKYWEIYRVLGLPCRAGGDFCKGDAFAISRSVADICEGCAPSSRFLSLRGERNQRRAKGRGVSIRLSLWKPSPQRPRRGPRPPRLDSPPGNMESTALRAAEHFSKFAFPCNGERNGPLFFFRGPKKEERPKAPKKKGSLYQTFTDRAVVSEQRSA